MSHSQFHSIDLFTLRHAWLNLWDKHMTTGRINQVATFKRRLRTTYACIHLECMQEVLSIEKLQAKATSFRRRVQICQCSLKPALSFSLIQPTTKTGYQWRLEPFAVGELSVDDTFRTLCSSAISFHPSVFVYDCTMWTDTRFPSFRTTQPKQEYVQNLSRLDLTERSLDAEHSLQPTVSIMLSRGTG